MELHQMPVHMLMVQDVVTIHQGALIADAVQLMDQWNFRRLPVLDDDGGLVGIVTATDILEAETADRVLNTYEPGVTAEWLSVAEIMTRDVITISPHASVGELASKLLTHKIGGMPVVEPDPGQPRRQTIVGIVTEADIFQALARAWQAQTSPQKA